VPVEGKISRDDYILFSESNSRFIAEVKPENKVAFEKVMKGTVFALIGRVTETGRFAVTGVDGTPVLNEKIAHLKEAWQEPLRW